MTEVTVSPSSNRTVLSGIDSTAFQHPLDRQATLQLRKVRGFDTFMAKFLELGFERIDYALNVASNVRVSPRQLPRLHNMLRECCAVLDVSEPELYVSQVQEVNAHTFGHNHPYIVIQTGLLDLMDDDEVMTVIAHEVGHIKCGHVLYTMMAYSIGFLTVIAGQLTLGIGALVGKGLDAALLTWSRRAELSADRAALLVMQDARPCVSMLMKMAGGTSRYSSQLDPEEFLTQARAYGEEMDRSLSDRFYRFMAATMRGTHPFVIERAKELNDWIDSPEYDQILTGNYAHSEVPAQDDFCTNCGAPVQETHKFCAGCGQPIAGR